MKRFVSLIVATALAAVLIDAGPVFAKEAKPGTPKVVKVTSKNKGSKSNITVTIKYPKNNGGSKITGIKIFVDGKKCTATGSKKSCTVKGIKKGKKVNVSAQVINRKGFSKSSKKLKYKAGSKALKVSLSKTKVIAKTESKFRDFQALGKVTPKTRHFEQHSNIRKFNSPNLEFDSSGAVGLATVEDDNAAIDSGLVAVTASGGIRDALVSGDASIIEVLTSPNGKYYVLFESPTSLTEGGLACLLAEVNYLTGMPTCLDSDVTSIQWEETWTRHGKPIQFDKQGNIFFVAGLASGKTSLRKYSNGTVKSLISDNININDFLVMPNGNVIVSGSTVNTNVKWTRLIKASGGVKNLLAGQDTSFISKFADGRIYLGTYDSKVGWNIRRLNKDGDGIESKYWVQGDVKATNNPCYGEKRFNDSFCSSSGAIVVKFFNVLGKRTYGLSGNQGSASLVQYHPTFKSANTSVEKISISQLVISNIIFAGTNSSGTNTLTIYDTGNDTETILMDSSNEIEIYNMTYIASTNSIMFDGLRFSDNQFVVGSVSLN
jgi:hypothetical protein